MEYAENLTILVSYVLHNVSLCFVQRLSLFTVSVDCMIVPIAATAPASYGPHRVPAAVNLQVFTILQANTGTPEEVCSSSNRPADSRPTSRSEVTQRAT